MDNKSFKLHFQNLPVFSELKAGKNSLSIKQIDKVHPSNRWCSRIRSIANCAGRRSAKQAKPTAHSDSSPEITWIGWTLLHLYQRFFFWDYFVLIGQKSTWTALSEKSAWHFGSNVKHAAELFSFENRIFYVINQVQFTIL